MVRSGYVAANRHAIGPPSDTPKMTARSDPAASITARTSSIRVSSEGSRSSETRSESPMPRLSNRIEPREGGDPAQEVGEARFLPQRLDVGRPPHHPDEVERSVADHLVRDVDPVGGLRVPRFGDRHRHALSAAREVSTRASSPRWRTPASRPRRLDRLGDHAGYATASSWRSRGWTATTAGRRSWRGRSATLGSRSSTRACTRRPSRSSRRRSRRTPTRSGSRCTPAPT